jgi:hypothetical protein
MPPSPSPPPDRSRDASSLVTRFGTVAGVGTAGAMACSFPAALRLARAIPGGESAAHVWVALAAAALLPMAAAVVVLGPAREGSRAFGGAVAGVFGFGVAMWLVLVGVGLAVFGSALRATTHHHALAGVTFALCGLLLALCAAAVCARVVALLKLVPPGLRRFLMFALSAVLTSAVVWLALLCARASSRDEASAAQVGTVVDILAFLLAAALAARQALVVRRILALVGPPAVVVVLAVGVPALQSESFQRVVREKAPAFAVAAELLAPRR